MRAKVVPNDKETRVSTDALGSDVEEGTHVEGRVRVIVFPEKEWSRVQSIAQKKGEHPLKALMNALDLYEKS